MRLEGRENNCYLKPILNGKCKLCFFSRCFLASIFFFNLKKPQIYLFLWQTELVLLTLGSAGLRTPRVPKVLYGITAAGHLAPSSCWTDLGHISVLKLPLWSKVSLPNECWLAGRAEVLKKMLCAFEPQISSRIESQWTVESLKSFVCYKNK